MNRPQTEKLEKIVAAYVEAATGFTALCSSGELTTVKSDQAVVRRLGFGRK